MDRIPTDAAWSELQEHGFSGTRAWIPAGPFHERFPLGGQVKRIESTVAYVYTQGSTFAFAANRLCIAGDWDELFREYGGCVRCLWAYAEKMQARYGQEQTLFRGMQADWDEFLVKYRVGELVEWRAFSSTSTNIEAAKDFATGVYSGGNQLPKRPVLFVIETRTRGAPLLSWSLYPAEDEILLLPFQRFQVNNIQVRQNILTIHMSTIKPGTRPLTFQVLTSPGLAYRYSRDVHDRDDLPAGPSLGAIVEGTLEGDDWILVDLPHTGDRFLPLSIDGTRKLRAIEVRGSQDDERDDFRPSQPEPCAVM